MYNYKYVCSVSRQEGRPQTLFQCILWECCLLCSKKNTETSVDKRQKILQESKMDNLEKVSTYQGTQDEDNKTKTHVLDTTIHKPTTNIVSIQFYFILLLISRFYPYLHHRRHCPLLEQQLSLLQLLMQLLFALLPRL